MAITPLVAISTIAISAAWHSHLSAASKQKLDGEIASALHQSAGLFRANSERTAAALSLLATHIDTDPLRYEQAASAFRSYHGQILGLGRVTIKDMKIELDHIVGTMSPQLIKGTLQSHAGSAPNWVSVASASDGDTAVVHLVKARDSQYLAAIESPYEILTTLERSDAIESLWVGLADKGAVRLGGAVRGKIDKTDGTRPAPGRSQAAVGGVEALRGTAYQAVPLGFGMSLIAVAPPSALNGASSSFIINLIAMSALISAGAGLLIVALVNQTIVRRVRALESASKSIADGNFDVSIKDARADEIGALSRSFLLMRDSIFASKNKIHQLAYFDDLTGLANRRSQNAFLGELLSASSTGVRRRVAVLLLDLDDFKNVNDIYGHHIGDALLKEIASRLQKACASLESPSIHIQISRIAGDEFTIVACGYRDDHWVDELASIIVGSFAQPFEIGRHILRNSVSLGVALCPQHGHDQHTLLKCADLAMYEAKLKGKNRYSHFTEELRLGIELKQELERRIIEALANDQMQLHYQPKVCLVDSRVTHFEALIRWNDPQRGMVLPATFIPFAEDNGLINNIGVWVIDRLCQDVRSLQMRGWSDFKVSFNVSARQFDDGQYIDAIEDALRRHAVNPKHLEVELTEYSLAKDMAETRSYLERITGLGLGLSIDDFGTGYSCLSYLEKLPIDTLKVDASFIRDAAQNYRKMTIIATIVTLAKGLGMKTVAEGVETQSELQIALDHGCDYVQGYYFYRPMPFDEILGFEAYQCLETHEKADKDALRSHR